MPVRAVAIGAADIRLVAIRSVAIRLSQRREPLTRGRRAGPAEQTARRAVSLIARTAVRLGPGISHHDGTSLRSDADKPTEAERDVG